MKNKNRNWFVFWLIALILVLAALVVFWRRQPAPLIKPPLTTANPSKPPLSSSPSSPSQPPTSPPANSIQDQTKIQIKAGDEAEAKKIIDQFEANFSSGDFAAAFALFSPAVRDEKQEGKIRLASPAPPRIYEITSMTIRGDGTILSQIVETRADNSLQRRFIEQTPKEDGFKVTSYFRPTDVSIYSGFLLDEIN